MEYDYPGRTGEEQKRNSTRQIKEEKKMAIAGVNGYAGGYGANSSQSAVDNRKQAGESRTTGKAGETGAAGRTNETAASGTASTRQTTKEYIRGLEEKYGVNITIGKNTTAKSFKDYMLGSAGGNNVYIESNIAEKMASDPLYAQKYEELIAKVPEQGKQVEKDVERLSNGKSKVIASGMQIHKNGKVTYWGVSVNVGPLERLGTKYRKMADEKLEKQREAKKKSDKQAEKLEEAREAKSEAQEKLLEKRTIQADSMAGVLENWAAGDHSELNPAVKTEEAGGRIDLLI